jgi:dienelactone hydrolase
MGSASQSRLRAIDVDVAVARPPARREQIFTFGPNDSVVGILTEPDPARARPHAPVVIASNVGMNHRVGPFRAWVELARRLADSGFAMLRFDLSGMGDSEPRRDERSERERALADVREAMSALADRKGIRRFVQVGMCSGVDSAHAISVEDPRVVAAAFIEGFAYPTPRFYLHRYGTRLANVRFWTTLARRKLERLLPSDSREAGGGRAEIYTREYPARHKLAADFDALAGRGVQLLFVYSGGAEHAYNYGDQFYDLFPRLVGDRHVEVDFMPDADHVYSAPEQRRALVTRLTRWMQAHFAQ